MAALRSVRLPIMRALIALVLIFSILRTDTRTIVYADPIIRPAKPVAHKEALPATELAEVSKVTIPKPKPVRTAAVRSGSVANCGDNYYAHFIYMKESGCRTDSVNSLGCRGIGQACPGSKLPCSNYDYPCQNRFFTAYAVNRYGGWQQAYNAWLRQHWW